MPNITIDVAECRKEGRLPPVCMVCGEPADHYVRKVFSWYPPWIAITILAGLLVWVILVALLTKRCTVFAPMCSAHKGHWTRIAIFTALVVMAALGCMLAGIIVLILTAKPGGNESLGGFAMLAGALGMLFLLLVAAFVSRMGVRCYEITDYKISLMRVDEEFIAALKKQRKKQGLDPRDGEPLDDEDDEDDDDDEDEDEQDSPRRRDRSRD
jgi:hypothetical protein